MKNYSPIVFLVFFSSFLFLSSCKDKKPTEKKVAKTAIVKKAQPKIEKTVAVEKVKPTPPPKPQLKKIIVKKGEWLYDIARKEYGNSQSWKKIYEANKKLIDNPDMIYPNQEFIIPE